jgi:hypothetical protein
MPCLLSGPKLWQWCNQLLIDPELAAGLKTIKARDGVHESETIRRALRAHRLPEHHTETTRSSCPGIFASSTS